MKAPSVRFCILDVDYIVEDGKPVIRIWGKTQKGKSVVVFDREFKPYFYVEPKAGLPEADLETLKSRIMDMEIEGKKPERFLEVDKKFLGVPKKMLQIFVQDPPDVPKFRGLLKDWGDIREEYEYGVPFAKRYLIDKGLIPMNWVEVSGREVKSGFSVDLALEADSIEPIDKEDYPPLHVLAFDIELSAEGGKEKIIMVSFMDNMGFKKVVAYGKRKEKGLEIVRGERGLVRRFVEIMREKSPDIIVGYNTDRFDFLKFAEKSEKYKIPLNLGRDDSHVIFVRRGRISSAYIKGRVHIDVYDFIEHILGSSLSTEVLTLDRVSKELIGIGKEKLNWKEIEEAWKKKDLKKLGKYCLQDSELTLKLANNLLPQMFELSRVVGQPPFDITRMTYSQHVEWLLIRRANESGEVSPNRPKYDEVVRRRKAAPYIGGYVHMPKEGIHNKIALFDFASLYPTITITHNISPETLDCKCCNPKSTKNKVPEQDHHYCAKNKGFITKILEELVKKRAEIKDKMEKVSPRTVQHKLLDSRQYALKILANASYGYYGYPGSRWYSRVCAESITLFGRFYIKKVIKIAERMELEVIYGDTDSLFLKIRKRSDVKDFLSRVNKFLPGVMELDFRNLYESGIFVLTKSGVAAKKRYALIDKKGKIIIRGFEKVRRDWANIAKNAQERVLLAILKDKSPKKAVRIVRGIISDLEKGKVNLDDLIIYTQITKPLDQYDQIGPHVAAAKKALERGRIIKEGSTISYVITRGLGTISSRAEPAVDATNYDPGYYIHNQVIPAALRILSGLGYTEDHLLGEEKKEEQLSLKKYMKG